MSSSSSATQTTAILKQLKIDDASELKDRFAEIASFLLNNVDLVVAGGAKRFQLAEIEFYYCSSAHHDVFAHQDPMQKEFGLWYFHRAGPGKAYKEGTYKGLDLSLGNGTAFCGVLIRSLRDAESGDVVQGSCLCVNAILAAVGAKGVTEFADRLSKASQLGFASTDAAHPLRLVPAAKARTSRIDTSMRVGLTLKKTDHRAERTKFIGAEYRFTTAADVIRKGAPQQVAALAHQGHDNAMIANITKLKPKIVENYKSLFLAGKKRPLKGLFGVAIKPADYAEAYGRWVAHINGEQVADDNDVAADDDDDDDDEPDEE